MPLFFKTGREDEGVVAVDWLLGVLEEVEPSGWTNGDGGVRGEVGPGGGRGRAGSAGLGRARPPPPHPRAAASGARGSGSAPLPAGEAGAAAAREVRPGRARGPFPV